MKRHRLLLDVAGHPGFPRLYAAASLKRERDALDGVDAVRFPRLYAAASLKRYARPGFRFEAERVFRGFMPRPH